MLPKHCGWTVLMLNTDFMTNSDEILFKLMLFCRLDFSISQYISPELDLCFWLNFLVEFLNALYRIHKPIKAH